MKIVVVGTRGIPDIQGGVETHCEQLYPRIAAMGHDVTVMRRSCYVTPQNKLKEYKGVRLKDVFAPRIKSIEAILHTMLAVVRARAMKPDVLHIHAIGPSIMMPLARLLGMKTVMTHHGFDYNRGKWGRLAKFVLRAGEKYGVRHASKVIVISEEIRRHIAETYGRNDAELIFNGVPKANISTASDFIESKGLERGKYVVAVGRFVPEKCFDMLIEAFHASELSHQGYKLAIAGGSDHPDQFSQKIEQLAEKYHNEVVLTGFIKGEPLQQLLSHAALFCLPSTHEGLPIALLEAMSYNLDVLVSDIEANMIPEINGDTDAFPAGNADALREALKRKFASIPQPRVYDLSAYNWDHIAQQTVQLYARLL